MLDSDRHIIFDENYGFAVSTAARFCRERRQHRHNRDDFVQVALVSMWECIQRYNPELCRFPTFAERRIMGGMLDYARSQSWGPRRERFRAMPSGCGVESEWLDQPAKNDVMEIDVQDECDYILNTVACPRRREILWLRAVEERSVKEIGTMYGVTDTRISQLMTDTTKYLRENLVR